MPFGTSGMPRESAGAIARQLAGRLVERLAAETAVELRPVLVVGVADRSPDEAYVVLSSAPDADFGAQMGASLECTHTLMGAFRDDADRALEVSLIDTHAKRPVREEVLPARAGALHLLEPALAAWLAHALGLELADRGAPAAANEPAYAELLQGMDVDVSAKVAHADVPVAAASRAQASGHYAMALIQDPECEPAAERLLVRAAESLGTGEERDHLEALESALEARPRSWQLHYLIGELRRSLGDVSGAIVAFEHAHSLRPLRAEDAIALAELYVQSGAPGQAAAHLRRVRRGMGPDTPARTRLILAHGLIRAGRHEEALAQLGSVLASERDGESAARARRLRLGLTRPDLEAELERAGQQAMGSGEDALAAAAASFARVLEADPDLWEAEFGLGLVARRQENANAAIRSFRRTLELWPGQPDAVHELGVVLLATGHEGEALELLEQAARARPDDAGYLADAGLAQLRAGDLTAARERISRAAALEPNDPLTRTYLAELERVEKQIASR